MLKIKSIIFQFLMVLLVIIVIYCLGELIVYGIFKKEIALFPRYVTGVTYNDFKIRRNVPNAKYKHKSYDGEWEFRINNQGFRSDVEYAYKKPADTIRILILGDSYTLGHEVNQDETYSVVLEKKLKEKGISSEVINAGVSGFSNAEELVFYEQEGIKFSPDILIVGFYNNDLRDNIRAGIYKLENNNLVLSSKEYLPVMGIRDFLNSIYLYRWLGDHSYLHNYLNAVATEMVKKYFVKENLETIAHTNHNPNFEKAIADTREITLPSDMNNRGYEVQLTCRIIEKMKEIADEHKTTFILLDIALDVPPARPNLFPSFPKHCIDEKVTDYYVNSSEMLKQYQGSRDDLYRPHGKSHWTEISHAIVGEHLAEVISKIIGRR